MQKGYVFRGEDGAFSHVDDTSGGVEWRGVTLGNLQAMTDAERVAVGIYRRVIPSVSPTEFEKITGFSYSFDDAAGTCQESFVIEPLSQSELTRVIASKVDALWASADKYTSSYISGVAVGLLTIGVVQQKPKALAISAWSSSVWDLYYQRKALLLQGTDVDMDFSVCGAMPCTVPELREELGL